MKKKLVTDTSNFFSIGLGDIIQVGGRNYEVLGHAREFRFGIEDPKFWVKRTVDIETGEKKIIKLSFFETFETSIGGVKIRCFRNPEKEGNILKLVENHPNFMQGKAYIDSCNNCVRVIDTIRGMNFLYYIDSFKVPHETYIKNILPDILKKLIKAFEGIHFLHANGFKHGDIRNDHIIVDSKTGNFVWIDFDYDFETSENPFSLDIFGLGNILIYAIGKGFHNAYMIRNDYCMYKEIADHLDSDDFSLLDGRRFINLRKLFPAIPEMLNNVLLHFSRGSNVYYESVDEIIVDLNRSLQAFK